MGKIKIGLALGSGAAKGLAHVGVIKALEEAGIEVSMVAGTSIGAVVGGHYAAGNSVHQMVAFAREFGKRRMAMWVDPSFFRGGGFLKGDKIEQILGEQTPVKTFKECKKDFFAVATDLVTGKRVVLSEGDLFRSIRASFAIPGLFSPVEREREWLADGAIVDPLPTDVLKEKKCNFIIAVNVNSLSPRGGKEVTSGGAPGLIEVLMQSLSITQLRLSEHGMDLADVSIVPDVKNFSWTDFGRSEELIEAGYRAAMEKMDSIKRGISRAKKFGLIRRLLK